MSNPTKGYRRPIAVATEISPRLINVTRTHSYQGARLFVDFDCLGVAGEMIGKRISDAMAAFLRTVKRQIVVAPEL